MKNAATVLLLLCVCISPVHALDLKACTGTARDYPSHITVLKINDGDTVTASINRKTEKIRLIGIDSPELAQVPWGYKSRDFLKKLIAKSNWKVKIEYDVQKRDQFGRILGYLWTKDGKMLNYDMIRNGLAVIYTVAPNICYEEEFRKAQAKARSQKKGFWVPGGLSMMPSEYRKLHPRLD